MFQAPEVTPADQIPEFKWVAPDEEVRHALLDLPLRLALPHCIISAIFGSAQLVATCRRCMSTGQPSHWCAIGCAGADACFAACTQGIKKFLVDENGFNHERVTKVRPLIGRSAHESTHSMATRTQEWGSTATCLTNCIERRGTTCVCHRL